MKTPTIGDDRNFANLFFLVRERLGMTMTQLANNLGLSKSTVSLYESGKRFPKAKVLLWYLEEAGRLVVTKQVCPRCNGSGYVADISYEKDSK